MANLLGGEFELDELYDDTAVPHAKRVEGEFDHKGGDATANKAQNSSDVDDDSGLVLPLGFDEDDVEEVVDEEYGHRETESDQEEDAQSVHEQDSRSEEEETKGAIAIGSVGAGSAGGSSHVGSLKEFAPLAHPQTVASSLPSKSFMPAFRPLDELSEQVPDASLMVRYEEIGWQE